RDRLTPFVGLEDDRAPEDHVRSQRGHQPAVVAGLCGAPERGAQQGARQLIALGIVATAKHAVVIAGGGPTGLMLAGELALARVDVAIVERRGVQELAGARSGGLHSRTIEV